jgi:RNA polymerase sigma-70 factor (ECF subfamily)
VNVERIFRAEYDRAVAVLVRHFGDIDLAEDAVQEAFVAALRSWPERGVPPSPAGWIITTARNRATDVVRRERTRAAREAAAETPAEDAVESDVPDERLRLIFTCCHPALAPAARVALTLRLLGG